MRLVHPVLIASLPSHYYRGGRTEADAAESGLWAKEGAQEASSREGYRRDRRFLFQRRLHGSACKGAHQLYPGQGNGKQKLLLSSVILRTPRWGGDSHIDAARRIEAYADAYRQRQEALSRRCHCANHESEERALL